MKTNLIYMNCETGEATEVHREAMEWYRVGTEVALMGYSETLGEWIERGRWVH